MNPAKYQNDLRSNIVKIRGFVVIASVVFSIIAYLTFEFEVLAVVALVGFVLSVASFIEPFVNRAVNMIFKETTVVERRDIYQTVIEQINAAKKEICFKTPTTTWGMYSEGLHVFVDTMAAIENATSRGVKVRIIADIWDWERAKFAEALVKSGAELRFSKTTHDYFVIRDTLQVLTMGTDPEPYKIDKIDRTVRQLARAATLSIKTRQVELLKRKFDEDWETTSQKVTEATIQRFLTCKCPSCKSVLALSFSRGGISAKLVS